MAGMDDLRGSPRSRLERYDSQEVYRRQGSTSTTSARSHAFLMTSVPVASSPRQPMGRQCLVDAARFPPVFPPFTVSASVLAIGSEVHHDSLPMLPDVGITRPF